MTNKCYWFLTDIFETGGIETYLHYFSDFLNKNHTDVRIFHFTNNNSLIKKYSHVPVLKASSPLICFFRINYALFSEYFKSSPQIIILNTTIISFYSAPFLLFIKFLRKKPIIYQFHGLISLEWKSSVEKDSYARAKLRFLFRKYFLAITEIFTFYVSIRVITFSKYGVKLLKTSRVKSEKILFSPPGLPFSNLEIRHEFYSTLLIGKRNFVLAASRIEKRKGIYEMLKIFNSIQKEKPNMVFLFCSDFFQDIHETKKFFSTIKRYDLNLYFHQTPSRKKFFEYLKTAAIFLQPSTELETFGFTTLEALIAGTPVACFNIGANSELIVHKKNGFIRPTSQLQLLANDIVQFISKKHHITNTTQEFIDLSKFSWGEYNKLIRAQFFSE